jgi:hypothetical protein
VPAGLIDQKDGVGGGMAMASPELSARSHAIRLGIRSLQTVFK